MVVGGVTVAAVDDTGVVGKVVRSVPAQKKHTKRLIVIVVCVTAREY